RSAGVGRVIAEGGRKRQPALPTRDAGDLPTAGDRAGDRRMAEPTPPVAERQLPGIAGDKALANVEGRVAAVGAQVIGVLRRRIAAFAVRRSVVDGVAPRVGGKHAEASREAAFQLRGEGVVAG